MARELPNVGYCYYNGFTFPAPFFAEVRADLIQDTSRRTIKYTKYNITIRTLIVGDDYPTHTAGARTDDNLENIRCRLEKAGGAFIFYQQGFGDDFAVNCSGIASSLIGAVPSLNIDPVFGPFPKVLVWSPKGSNRSCEIVWTVEVTVPECCGNEFGTVGYFLEHNYSINWSINQDGATVRTINGYYEIANSRLSAANGDVDESRAVKTGDEEWDRIFAKIPHPLGFHRTTNHVLSLDKRQVNYTITDTEIQSDNPLFPYMVSMDITHTVSAAMPELWKHQNTVSGSVKIAPNTPRHWAYLAFAAVAKERYDKADSLPRFTAPGMDSGSQSNTTPNKFLTAYSFEEPIFGREFRFSFTWWFLAKLTDIFKGSGLFSKVTYGNPQWPAWTASMITKAQSARGTAGMGAVYGEGNIIQACVEQNLQNINGGALKNNNQSFIPNFIAQEFSKDPPIEKSYLAVSLTIESETTIPKITHLPADGAIAADAQMPVQDARKNDGVTLSKVINESAGNASTKVVQLLGKSSTTTVVQGRMVRVAFVPTIPTVTSVGGVKPIAQRVWQQTKIIGYTANAKPIFFMRYRIELDLPSKPANDILAATVTNADPGKLM